MDSPSPTPNPAKTSALLAPAVGLAGAGVFMLKHDLATALITAAAGIGSSVPLWAVGRRHALRDALEANAITAAAPTLGHRVFDRSRFRFQGWTRGTGLFAGDPGFPRRVHMHYERGLDANQAWVAQLRDALKRELGAEYAVDKHDGRRKRIVFRAELASEQAAPEEASKARTVLQELMSDSIQVSVESDEQGPVRIEVTDLPATRMAIGNRQRTVERVLAARLGATLIAKWNMAEATVVFERRPSWPKMIFPPAEHPKLAVLDDPAASHQIYKDFVVTLGQDEYGREYGWHPFKQAHGLVVGGTGSGKTVALHRATELLTQAGFRCWVLDGKKIEFTGFRGWPNVELITARTEHQIRMLLQLHELMEERYEEMEQGLAGPQDWEPVFVIIDEVTSFLQNAAAWWKKHKPGNAPMKHPFLDILANLLRLARSAKIHILVGMQRPDASIISGEARDNFGFRMSLGKLGPQGSQMMWDNPYIGVSLPDGVKGRAIIGGQANGQTIEIQTYFAPNPDENTDNFDPERVEAAKPTVSLYARRMYEIVTEARSQITGEVLTNDNGIPEPPKYEDFMAARLIEWNEDYIRRHTPQRKGSSILAPRIGTPATAHEPAMAAASSVAVLEIEDDFNVWQPEEEGDGFEQYQEEDTLPVSSVEPGDLVQLEGDFGEWFVVQGIEDFNDQAVLDCLNFHTGDPMCVELDENQWLVARKPIPLKD